MAPCYNRPPRPCRPRRTWQHSASAPRCRWRIWELPIGWEKTWEKPWEIWENLGKSWKIHGKSGKIMENPWENLGKSGKIWKSHGKTIGKAMISYTQSSHVSSQKTWSSWMLDGKCEIVLTVCQDEEEVKHPSFSSFSWFSSVKFRSKTTESTNLKNITLQTKSNDRMISPGITLLKPMRLLDQLVLRTDIRKPSFPDLFWNIIKLRRLGKKHKKTDLKILNHQFFTTSTIPSSLVFWMGHPTRRHRFAPTSDRRAPLQTRPDLTVTTHQWMWLWMCGFFTWYFYVQTNTVDISRHAGNFCGKPPGIDHFTWVFCFRVFKECGKAHNRTR